MLLQPLPASAKRTFSQIDDSVKSVPGLPGFGKKKLKKEAAAQRRAQQSRSSDYKVDYKGKGGQDRKETGKGKRFRNQRWLQSRSTMSKVSQNAKTRRETILCLWKYKAYGGRM